MQEIEKGIKAIVGGLLIDATGNPPVEDSVIVLEDSKIVDVGKRGEVSVPGDAVVIDAAHKTVMPGLIDAHVHLGYPYFPNERRPVYIILKTTDTYTILCAASAARKTLEAGVTTVRDLAGFAHVVPLRDAVNNGLLPGPRILAAGWVMMSGGHLDLYYPLSWPREEGSLSDGVWAVRKRVREFVREGVDLIKTNTSGGTVCAEAKDSTQWRNYTEEETKAIVDEAHAFDMRVASHASGRLGVEIALEAGVDTIEHGYFLDDQLIEKMLNRNVYLVPTMALTEDKYRLRPGMPEQDAETLRTARANAAVKKKNFLRVFKAGVKIAMGTDAYLWIRPGENAFELATYVENGVSEMDAIMMGTRNAAGALGRESEVGTIEKGKLADIIIVKGNPLRDISVLSNNRNILKVFKGGTVVKERSE